MELTWFYLHIHSPDYLFLYLFLEGVGENGVGETLLSLLFESHSHLTILFG